MRLGNALNTTISCASFSVVFGSGEENISSNKCADDERSESVVLIRNAKPAVASGIDKLT